MDIRPRKGTPFDTVARLEAGLKMLQAKYTDENMFTIADPDGNWPTPAGPTLADTWEQLSYDVQTILDGFDVREWPTDHPLEHCFGAWGHSGVR